MCTAPSPFREPRRAARGPQIIGRYKCRAVGARSQPSLMSRKTKEDIQMPSRTKLPMPVALVLMAAIIATPLAFGAANSVHAVRAASLYPYTLVDLGTLGGPQAGQGNAPSLSGPGVAVGTADTAMIDPYGINENGAFNGDPYVQHTFLWRGGVLTDLGALGPVSANNSSYPNGVN